MKVTAIIKERERCKKNYMRNKCRNTQKHIPEYILIQNSSVQDNIKEVSREGSHLAHFTQKSVINIGLTIRKILNCNSLANLKFLDVGCGQCIGLSYLSSVFKLHCVGIESNQVHFQSGVSFLFLLIKKMKDKIRIPFLPIKGDGLHLKNFGGAQLVYAWIQGAPYNLHQHLFKIFQSDKRAHVFVSDYYDMDHNLYHTSLPCVMSHNGGGRTLHFYVKKGPMNRERDRNLIKDEDTVDNQVRIAFRNLKHFRQSSDKTIKNMMELIHPLQLESQPTKKKRNLERISYKQFY